MLLNQFIIYRLFNGQYCTFKSHSKANSDHFEGLSPPFYPYCGFYSHFGKLRTNPTKLYFYNWQPLTATDVFNI